MNIKIWIESPYDKSEILKSARKNKITISSKNPDFVLTYGGDGTILKAEQKCPGIPKVPLRNSKVCSMCVSYGKDSLDYLFQKLIKKDYTEEKINKAEAIFKGKKLVGVNEIQIHNKDPRRAIRFNLEANGEKINEIIGDGLIFSTAFGSTAYYRSLGLEPFKKGVRIGFNNVYPRREPIELEGTAKVKIIREKALLIADNSEMVTVNPGEYVKIKKSKKQAIFVRL